MIGFEFFCLFDDRIEYLTSICSKSKLGREEDCHNVAKGRDLRLSGDRSPSFRTNLGDSDAGEE